MGKQDGYPPKPTLVGADYVTGVDSTGPSTIRILISAILNFVWTLANIPAGGTSPITRDNESQSAFVATGLIWTGDAYASTLLASMTGGTVYINGIRILISAVSHRAFTASKDTYVDILSNGDGTGTIVYTTVTNSAAAPALAANSTRIAKVVTGASNIAAATSIVQFGADSLSNVIYPNGSIANANVNWASFQPTVASTGTSWSGSGTTNILTSAAYNFIIGRKYMITVQSSNPNSTGVWQLSYSASVGGTQSGLGHARFGGVTAEQAGINLTNIFTPTASGSQTLTATATLVTSGSANGDDISIIITPLIN